MSNKFPWFISLLFIAIVALLLIKTGSIYLIPSWIPGHASAPKKEPEKPAQLPYNLFQDKIKNGQISWVTIDKHEVEGKFFLQEEGQPKPVLKHFKTSIVEGSGAKIAEEILAANPGAMVDIKPPENDDFMIFITSWLPSIVMIGFLIFFVRQMQGVGNRRGFNKNGHGTFVESEQNKTSFKDVAGVEEAKEELQEVVDFLKEPSKYQRLGGRIPKGVLLMGPPGTGKTLLARAVAGEADVPFLSITGSNFVEMFVGVGASRVRGLFEQAKKKTPCIIFIDEIDAVGRQRGTGFGGGHDEREQTLNQLLAEMDGFETNNGIIVIAASNRPDVLDPALLRPGRFDRQVVVPTPDLRGREQILRIHSRKIPLDKNIDLTVVARGTPGFSGAALENLLNEAVLNAARHDRKTISVEDLEWAKDKVLMGKERKSMLMSEEDKKITAYHEAGHTLVAYKTPGHDPIHKVTIIPRGTALGLTQQLPVKDRLNYSKEYLEGLMPILMGGRCAEKMFLGIETTGAANDLETATDYAKRMVMRWGLSSLGNRTFGQTEEQPFLGRSFTRHDDISEETKKKIDEEVDKITTEGMARAEKILGENRKALEALAKALLEYETLNSEDIERVIKGETSPA